MKSIVYTGGGPDVISAGEAGQFTKDVPREIEDDKVADKLLAKGYFREFVPELTPEVVPEATPAITRASKATKGEV
jgi:hypothetical protein